MSQAQAETMAVVLVHVLKAVPAFAQEEERRRGRLLGEARELVRLYISHAFRNPTHRRSGR